MKKVFLVLVGLLLAGSLVAQESPGFTAKELADVQEQHACLSYARTGIWYHRLAVGKQNPNGSCDFTTVEMIPAPPAETRCEALQFVIDNLAWQISANSRQGVTIKEDEVRTELAAEVFRYCGGEPPAEDEEG